jgi:transglutaminase-like putative cysteine protease
MNALTITHTTRFHYHAPVLLLPHRLLLRPRPGHDVALAAFALRITPPARIAWSHDVAGNAVAIARFDQPARMLEIESRSALFLDAVPWPVFDIAAGAIRYPLAYDAQDQIDLGALAVPQHDDPDGRLRSFARGFVAGESTDTLSLLKDLCAGIGNAIRYQARFEEGTHPPLTTLALGEGSCRDLAVLFAEAARHLGFGARIASGYLDDPATSVAADTTHAWAEAFVPGAGWISVDPTNRQVGGHNLIPVAVGCSIGQVSPISGSYTGPADMLDRMTVAVDLQRG